MKSCKSKKHSTVQDIQIQETYRVSVKKYNQVVPNLGPWTKRHIGLEDLGFLGINQKDWPIRFLQKQKGEIWLADLSLCKNYNKSLYLETLHNI